MADVSGVQFDKKDQFDQIVPWLMPNETLHFVFDCKGGGTIAPSSTAAMMPSTHPGALAISASGATTDPPVRCSQASMTSHPAPASATAPRSARYSLLRSCRVEHPSLCLRSFPCNGYGSAARPAIALVASLAETT